MHAAFDVAGAHEAPGTFDLAVLDDGLPDGNALDLARALLQGRRVGRVVFFTGRRDDARLAALGEIGIVIPKADGTRGLWETVEGLIVTAPPAET